MDESGAAAFAALIAPKSEEEFFAKIWQKQPHVFRMSDVSTKVTRPIPTQTWEDCCSLLSLAWGASRVRPPEGCDLLVFKGLSLTHDYEELGPCAALLDGASCAVNHAEFASPDFARLCRSLRDRLAHVYVNMYVTPAGSQAVPPHADDRDVFVLQLCGAKQWKVYGTPPIKLPYSDEQVGKNGLDVPEALLKSQPAIECTLHPGDVLYMPRGYVHEASCPGDSSSWHATLAVATHDWSWSKVVAGTLISALDSTPGSEWREAVPLSWASQASEDSVSREQLEELLDFVRKAVTPEALKAKLVSKLAVHNRNQDGASEAFAQALEARRQEEKANPGGPVPDHSHWLVCGITSSTVVRKATPKERELDNEEQAPTPRGRGRGGRGGGRGRGRGSGRGGLTVREELGNAVIAVLSELDKRKEEGLMVRDFGKVVQTGDRALFDDLAQLCLARVCIGVGAFRQVSQRSADEAAQASDQEQVTPRQTIFCWKL